MVEGTLAVVPEGAPVTESASGAAKAPTTEPQDSVIELLWPAARDSDVLDAPKLQDGAVMVNVIGHVRVIPPPVAVRVTA